MKKGPAVVGGGGAESPQCLRTEGAGTGHGRFSPRPRKGPAGRVPLALWALPGPVRRGMRPAAWAAVGQGIGWCPGHQWEG